MTFWTPDSFLRITGGQWLHSPQTVSDQTPLTGLNTDTRSVQPGQVFCALRGERFDAHDFLDQAAACGAAMLIVDRPEKVNAASRPNTWVLGVPDTRKALAQLAGAYRATFRGKVIGITGSVGKTTTKRLIHAALSKQRRGTASPKSFNNDIGVPLTLLAAKPNDDYTLVEIGTNAPGEIAMLSAIAQPDIAVITAIAPAHVGGLGGVDAILKEKTSMLQYLKPGGVAVLNGDTPGLRESGNPTTTVLYGKADDLAIHLSNYRATETGSQFTVDDQSYTLPLLGEHNAANALAAIAVGRLLGLTDAAIAEGLAHAQTPPMRLERLTLGEGDHAIQLINDAYNANPASMASAISVLCEQPASGRRVAVLGAMAELGSASEHFHAELGERVAASSVDLAIFVGQATQPAVDAMARHGRADVALHLPEFNESTLIQLADKIKPGDTVLIKASRSAALERLVPALEARFTPLRDITPS